MKAKIDDLIKEAIERMKQMSPDEIEAMRLAQRESWVRGEMGIGSDADEAAYREAYRSQRGTGHE